MADVERMKVKDLVDLLNKYSDTAMIELSINVDWCDNYGGGSASLRVIDGKKTDELMEVEG